MNCDKNNWGEKERKINMMFAEHRDNWLRNICFEQIFLIWQLQGTGDFEGKRFGFNFPAVLDKFESHQMFLFLFFNQVPCLLPKVQTVYNCS